MIYELNVLNLLSLPNDVLTCFKCPQTIKFALYTDQDYRRSPSISMYKKLHFYATLVKG